jgi:hypothetical protein
MPVNPNPAVKVGPFPPYSSPMSMSYASFVLIDAEMLADEPVATVGALMVRSNGLAVSYPSMPNISMPTLIFGIESVMLIEGFEII